MNPATLTAVLHGLIPLTAAMGIHVDELDDERIVVTAPLSGNHNHAGSAFAGALYSLASIAGWAFLHQLLAREQLTAELVLGDGQIRYRHPVAGDLRAELRVPRADQEQLLTTLRRGRKATMRLNVALPDAANPAARFEGLYVAVPRAAA